MMERMTCEDIPELERTCNKCIHVIAHEPSDIRCGKALKSSPTNCIFDEEADEYVNVVTGSRVKAEYELCTSCRKEYRQHLNCGLEGRLFELDEE